MKGSKVWIIFAALSIASFASVIGTSVEINYSVLKMIRRETEKLNEKIAGLEVQNAAMHQTIANVSKQCADDLIDQLNKRNDKTLEQIQKTLATLSTMTTPIANCKLSSRVAKLELEGFDSKLDEVVTNPWVRIISEQHQKGTSREYELGINKTCIKVTSTYKNIQSVNTNGKCARLFLDENCHGWSAAIYPGSDNSGNILNSKLQRVSSIGLCSRDEFLGASLITTPSGQKIIKDFNNNQTYFPDLVQFDSWDYYNNRVVVNNASQNPIEGYVLGNGGRLQYVTAFIRSHHLNLYQNDSGTIKNSSFWGSTDKHEGDIVGHAIPLALGGPADETYNAFPQTVEGAAKWKEITAFIPQCMAELPGEDLWVGLVFLYPNEKTKRPNWFTYRIRCGQEVLYGIVMN